MDDLDDLLSSLTPAASSEASRPSPVPAQAKADETVHAAGSPSAGPRITEPCFIDGMPLEEYHRPDITPTPALSSSGAKILLSQTPAHFRHEVLLKEREPKKAFEIGEAAHLMVLEPDLFEGRIVRIDAGDYKKQDARDQRDEARAAGLIPLLPREVEMIELMRQAIADDKVASILHEPAITERSYFWRDPETGVWLKARVDKLIDERPEGTLDLMDYKTSTDVRPDKFARGAYPDYGYHLSLSHYRSGIEAVTGDRVNHCILIAQEKTAPYVPAVYTLPPLAIQWADILMRRAIGLFAQCLETDTWPGYEPTFLDMPGWYERDLERRHEAGEFAQPDRQNFRSFDHAQGHAAQAPNRAE